jgi:hypothetical protein
MRLLLVSWPWGLSSEAVGAIAAIAAVCVTLLLAVLGAWRARRRVSVKASMAKDGHTVARVTNPGSETVHVTDLDLMVGWPVFSRLRHPWRARAEPWHPVSSAHEEFETFSLAPSAEHKDFFEFDEKKRKLPSRRPLGRVFVLRAPSRRELRIVCSLTTEDPAVARVKQLRPGQSPK